jgi:pyruvate, water dikinase
MLSTRSSAATRASGGVGARPTPITSSSLRACAEGDEGFVYAGTADFEAEELDLGAVPATRTRVMLNLANPAAAFRWWRLPVDGVGLARMEFVVSNAVKVHPMALVRFDELKDEGARAEIEALTRGYADRTDYSSTRSRRASRASPRSAIRSRSLSG